MNGGEPNGARGRLVVTLLLQLVQECQDGLRRDRIQIQRGWITVLGDGNEAQQQNHRIAVTERGMPAYATLFGQIFAEEAAYSARQRVGVGDSPVAPPSANGSMSVP